MRNGILVGFLGLVLSASLYAAEPTAEEIVELAIKAQGGADRLSKLKTTVSKSSGRMTAAFGTKSFTREMYTDWPESFRATIRFDEDKKMGGTTVVQGLKAWRSGLNTEPEEIPASEQKELRDEIHCLWVTTLIPLQESTFKLTTAGKTKVQEADAYGVKVSQRFRPDIILYFDAKTHLLVQASYKGTVAGLEVQRTLRYKDYKNFGGIELPTKVTEYHGKQEVMSITLERCDFPEKIDKDTFQKGK